MWRLSLALIPVVDAHGRLVSPPSRQGGTFEVAGTVCGYHDGGTQIDGGCDWLTNTVTIDGLPTLVDPSLLTTAESISHPNDTMNPGKNPWRSPGNAKTRSPCGNDIFHPELDGLDLPPNPMHTTWRAGTTVEVASTVYINHGGGWSYRLCPKSSTITEECFQGHYLHFTDNTATVRFTDGRETTIPTRHTADGLWSRNQIPSQVGGHSGTDLEFDMPTNMQGAKPEQWNFSIIEKVGLPVDLSPGDYLLSWRWDAEKSSQIWFSCADVTIEAVAVSV